MKIKDRGLTAPVIAQPEFIVSGLPDKLITTNRIQSIDLLRGIVMIIMALDHVRDYFHYDAFFYSPTDLSRTNVFLFFTRFITHYCAPIFVFLAGTSAHLSGRKKTKHELSSFLLVRGIWMIVAELFIVSLFRTFNPAYPYVNLQVIWAIGISMIALAGMIRMKMIYVLLIGLTLVFGHNLLDNVRVDPQNQVASFLWALLHEQRYFEWGYFTVHANYPVLAWIGTMALGFCCGSLYTNTYNEGQRKKLLLSIGAGAIILFIALRAYNLYGDPRDWSQQENPLFSFLSFINVTKYPPSLQYLLITIGPALIFLSVTEKPLRSVGERIAVFGRVPMFYYLAHILLIHILAAIAAVMAGYPEMLVLSNNVFRTDALKGFGFNLGIVYVIWIVLVVGLYPFCEWFDQYKRTHHGAYRWLSYF